MWTAAFTRRGSQVQTLSRPPLLLAIYLCISASYRDGVLNRSNGRQDNAHSMHTKMWVNWGCFHLDSGLARTLSALHDLVTFDQSPAYFLEPCHWSCRWFIKFLSTLDALNTTTVRGGMSTFSPVLMLRPGRSPFRLNEKLAKADILTGSSWARLSAILFSVSSRSPAQSFRDSPTSFCRASIRSGRVTVLLDMVIN